MRARQLLRWAVAAGGIGFAAMQLGKYLGARVIGAVGSRAKANFLASHGFTENIVYPEENFKDRVNALTGGLGADTLIGGNGNDEYFRRY